MRYDHRVFNWLARWSARTFGDISPWFHAILMLTGAAVFYLGGLVAVGIRLGILPSGLFASPRWAILSFGLIIVVLHMGWFWGLRKVNDRDDAFKIPAGSGALTCIYLAGAPVAFLVGLLIMRQTGAPK